MQQDPLTLIQLTDSHLFGNQSQKLMGINTCQSFTDTVEMVLQQESSIDQVLVTGDISQDNNPESYLFCQKTLAILSAPYAWLCGNHDEADELNHGHFSNCFPKKLQLGNWIVLLLNSQVPGETYGELSSQELEYMEQVLSENPYTPTLLAMHHHPLCIGSLWMDSIPMKNGQHLVDSLVNHPQVKIILHGHIHQERETKVNGVHILATPSTSVQFAPKTNSFTADTIPPGYRKTKLYPDGHFETKVYRLPEGSWMPDLSQPGY